MRQGAQGWCTGMTLRDGMGRWVGRGIRMAIIKMPINETGCSSLVHWDDPEGWDGEGGGKGLQDGGHMYTHG